MSCIHCSSTDVERVIVESFDYDGFGIPIILFRSVLRTECRTCKHFSHAIPRLGELAATVAIDIAMQPTRLTGDKLKFMRKAMSLKARELAVKLNTSPETISRLESNSIEISDAMDLRFRLCVISELRTKAPGVEIDGAIIAAMANTARVASNNPPAFFEQIRRAKLLPLVLGTKASTLDQMSN